MNKTMISDKTNTLVVCLMKLLFAPLSSFMSIVLDAIKRSPNNWESKRPKWLLLVLFSLTISSTYAQLATPFTPRLTGGNIKVKGDVLLIGNSIIKGKGLASPYNNLTLGIPEINNNAQEGEYIDVDSDPTTFSSSTAKLEINNSCKRIVFAGLYWASIYPNEVATNAGDFFTGTPRLNDWNQVKLKLPNGTNLNLTANKTNPKEVIFDGYNYSNINNSFKDSPIICFKDITTEIAALANADGDYTLANLRATRGRRQGGCAAGWTLVIIYESPTLPSKFISVFDGYAGVQGTNELNIPISGFQTLPSPFPVNAKIGVSALEGDLGIKDDTFQFKAASKPTFTSISDVVSAANNFFNSSNSNNGVRVTSGNPASTNLLGYDIKNVKIPNASNKVIPNNETAGDLKLTTSGDGYGAFVTTFAVDIIEPSILLTKEVKDDAGNDASGANVTPEQQLNYVIGFENQGNDDAAEFTIKDKLPLNVSFNYPADIDAATLPAGVKYSYVGPSAANGFRGELTFVIPNNLVKANLTPGPPFVRYEIKFKVKVSKCSELSDACENRIQNIAYARYRGITNTTFFDEESYASYTACNLGTPQPTNFLVGVNDCLFTQNAVLCGSSTTITASNGYKTYTWTGPFGFTATGQTVTVTNPGLYKVFGEGNRPCIDYKEEITVAPFGGTTVNPVTAYADNAPDKNNLQVCPDNGKFLPKIFLCGQNDSRLIATGISGATSIVWETTTCAAPTNLSTLCANEEVSCIWTSAGPNGPNFTANTAGQFRLTINYAGGCFNRYYFNVYKNTLNPTATKTDIYCNTPGSITVGNVPSGYEYSLNNVNYQSSNIFSIATAGLYNVYIRQTGVNANPCIFQVKDIQISPSSFSTTVNATQPRCYGDKATILVAANNVRPQYKFDLYLQSGAFVSTSGLITASNQHPFVNVSPGKYNITTTTDDGCTDTKAIEIIAPSQLAAVAAITKALTCTDGEITVTPSGGTAPYNYSVNGAPFVTDPIIPVAAPGGSFSIEVVDANNCSITLPAISLNVIPKPVYTIDQKALACYGINNGEIKFNVSNANGYSLGYSIDNGTSFNTNETFSNLAPGTYTPVLEYSLNKQVCTEVGTPITITGATSAVSASAGVARLAGCTLSNQGGTLRITNVQGGVAPYTYSFDGGATYQAAKEKDVLPGSYTLIVKDNTGCTFTIPYTVILDPIPTPPAITVDTTAFNCDGTATSTVTVTNSGSANYTYEYFIDGVKNPNTANPKVFLNVPGGSHEFTVKYTLVSVSTYSNLLEENFGSGAPTTTPGIAAAYCFNDQRVNPPYLCKFPDGTGSRSIEDNAYSVASFFWRGDDPSSTNVGAWYHFKDHTTNGVDPNGRMLHVNIGSAAGPYGVLYSKPIVDVIPNQLIKVEVYLANLLRAGISAADPDFIIELVDPSGTVVASQFTGVIAAGPTSPDRNKWVFKTVSLNPGNNTNLTFRIKSGSILYSGNDAVIDDIKVYQLPETCITEKKFPVVVPSDKKFTAAVTGFTNLKCFGSNDGTITIAAANYPAAGFYYSVDGAAFLQSATSPVTIGGLSASTHSIRVQYDLSSSPCLFNLSQPITAPTEVSVTATVTTQPTCSTGATITAVAANGTPGYQYELRRTDGSGVTAFRTNGVFTNITTGNYVVVARDTNQCLSSASATVIVNAPVAPVATLDPTSNICYDAINKATLVVSVTGGTGTLSYSLDGGAGQNTNTFTNVGPGTHTIVVTDSNNCTATISGIVIANELQATPTITKTLDCSPTTPNATINVAIAGGTAAYTYTVKQDTGSYGASVNVTGSSFSYSASTSGLYTFLITDASGCTVTTTATVNAISNPTVVATPTQVSCFGGTNGEVQLVGSGGSGGYTYSFNGPLFTATSIYKNLSAGITYPYQVKDSKGCIGSGTITLTQPSQLVISATATTFTCSATNVKQTATVTIAIPTTGTAPYTYSFDNGATYVSGNTKTYTDNGSDELVQYAVKDANGCPASGSLTLKALNPPTDLTFANASITCTATTTTVTATAVVSSGSLVTPLTYEITAPATSIASNTTGVFAGLSPNTYSFKVTDANGCFYTESYEIKAVTPIAVTGNKVSDVLCNAGTTGAINFTVSGNAIVGDYTYSISPNTGTATKTGDTVSVTGLSAATYTIIVTDSATGCTATAFVVIAEPAALTLTAVGTNVNCNNFLSQITATAGGGTANYTYAAVKTTATAPTTFGANPVIVDTNSGADLVWDVYAKDANGCTTFTTISIVLDATPTVTAVVSNQCIATGTNFTITATEGGTGVAPFTYSIDGTNFKAGNTFNVSPGSYTVTIKDNNGCTSTATPLIVYPTLTAAAVTKQLDCSATPDGSITVTIGGGKANYSYTVQKGLGTPSAAVTGITGPTFTYPVLVANADTYTFVITDANGCTTTVSATIDVRTNPTLAIASQTNVTCNGLSNGSVTLTASGGSGTGYTYSKDGTTYGVSATFAGLAASATPYTFYVKDSKGCLGTVNVTITEPAVLTVTPTVTPFTCSTSNVKQTATVTLTADLGTGTAPYTYSFDNGVTFVTSNTKTYTDNGTDQVVNYQVKDANGCPASGSLTLKALNPPTDLTFTANVITCIATITDVTVQATNGVGILKYEITSPASAATSITTTVANGSATFIGLSPNTYNFKVTDANGCFYSESFEVKPVTKITLSGNKLADVKCKGENTGSARFTVGSFATTYSYTLNGVGTATGQTATTINLPTLAAGTYIVVVTDDVTGCDATATVTIVEPTDALTASIISNVNAYCNVPTSKVTVSAAGGTPTYMYAFVQNNIAPVLANYSTTATANLDPAINTEWDVWAKDANGCTFKVDVTIAADPIPTVAASAVNQCLGSGTYTITATNTTTPAAGIVNPITYSINNGAYQPGNTFTVTAAGDYIIRMKDGNGCIATSNTVTVNPILTLSAKLDKNITCFLPADAQITLTAAGGNGTYTYESKEAAGLYTAMTTNVFTTTSPGSYTFRVTDTSASGCIATTTTAIVIVAAVNPVISNLVQTQTIKCNGDATGAFRVDIDATQGQAPFRYSIDGGTNYQTSNIFTGLIAGTYTVTLQDAKGCTTTRDIPIGQPNPIVIDYDVEDIKCVPGSGTISQGSITINSVSGGTANYNYYVTGINGYYKEELNTPGSSVIFDIVDFGLYQIRVTDANGCQVTIDDVKIASAPDDLDINITSTADCVSGGTANVSIGTTLSSAGPFHFNIYRGPGQLFTADGSDGWQGESAVGSKVTTFTGLLPGVTYTFIVYDSATQCYYFETAATPIPSNSLLTLTNIVENNVKCFSDTYGSVNFDVTNAYPTPITVTYQVYEAFTNNLIAGAGISVPVTIAPGATLNITDLGSTVLTVGTYYVLVNEVTGPNAGCSAVSADFNIKKSPSQLSLTASAIQKSNCNDLGVISAEAKDGTGPYTYQVVASLASPVATDWVSTAIFERAGSVTGIVYDVYAKDAYGCIVDVPVTVYADAAPTITAPAPICYDGTAFTITISGTVDPAIVGAATYSVNGSAFQSSPAFTFNAAGTYNLVIKDGNGCTVNVDYIVYSQLDLKAEITKELDCTGSPDATITLTTTGRNATPSANYTYQVSYNGGPTSGASAIYTATAAGNYLFTVTDANNTAACVTTVSITVEAIPTPTITPSVTDVSCFGGNDGSISVTVTGGVGPYTYALNSSPANTTGDITGIYTGLIAGTTYEVTVTDAKSCDYLSGPITVDQPTALDASAAVTTALTCGPANAATEAVVTVTVTAGTGTAPYEYSFDGGANYSPDNTFKTFTAGAVNAIVKDAKGCTFNVPTATVDALDPPVITTITGTPIYCAPVASTTSTVTINYTNGIGTLSFNIIEPTVGTPQASNVFTGLAAGTYLFQVTDANGCTAQQYYTVDDVVNVTVSGQIISDVKCFGESNGSVEFTVDNYASTYSYTINGGSATTGVTNPTISLTGLAAGAQTIVVTDETSLCTATYTVNVTEPAIALSVVATLVKNANCNFGARVSAIASDGTPGYTYAFALASAGAPAAGDYTAVNTAVLDATLSLNWIAYAKDANGCVAQDVLTLAIDALPTIDVNANLYCYDGSPITVTITGTYVGTNPKYSIGNGYQSSPDFVLNAPGTYQFFLQDENGCIVQETFTLNQELLLNATLTQDLTCDIDASITFLATQGSLSYTTYEVSINGAPYNTITGSPYIATTPGTYQFRVTDSAGCQTVSQEIVVTPKTNPTFTYTQTNVTCIGGNDGVITITAANGIAPYSYSINGGTPQTSNVFKNLIAGTYTIEVKDAKGCFPVTQDVIITEPLALNATITVTTPLSCGTANATQAAVVTVTVDATTGTGPYEYSFDGGFNYTTSNTFTTFSAGTVSALVRDANGCIIAAAVSVDVDALDPPVITTITGTPIYCAPVASTTSTVTIGYTNGIGTLSFNIIEPTVGTPQASNVFTGLAAGTYLFQVTDANGCTAQQYYTVDDVVNITVSGQVIKDVACIGDANGEIEFKAANYNGTYSVLLTPGSGTLTQTGDTVKVTGLIAGTYTLRVIDDVTNCFEETTVTVKQPTALTLVEVSNVNATCNKDAFVTVQAAGGTPAYLYAFVADGATPTTTDYSTVANAVLDKTIPNWDVYVKDSNNCETKIDVAIAIDPLPTGITISGLSQCPSLTGDYTFTVAVGSGVGPYQYSIGAGFQTSTTFTVTNSGSYDITVKDANECEVTIPALVSIFAPLDLQVVVTTLPSCNFNDGVVDASVTGGSGTGNYRFQIDGGVVQNADNYSFIGLAPGLHTVLVRDVITGCIAAIDVNLEAATDITGLVVTGTDISCNGGNDGTITATIAANAPGVNDNPVYTFELSGTTLGGTPVTVAAQTVNVFENLEAGDYTVIVRSGRGCAASDDITLIQPALIVVPAPVVSQFGCNTGTNGANFATITVNNVTGGSGTYTVYEFIKGTTVVQTGTSTVYTEADYAGGSYSINVYDDNNCMGSTTATVDIVAYTALDKININVNTAITCNNLEEITATAVDAAGNPILGVDYTLVDDLGTISVTNSNGIFNNLSVGNYIITALNTTTNCSIQTVHYINEPNTFVLQAVKTADVVCFGGTDGAVTINLVDTQTPSKAGAFTYTVTGPTPSSGTTTSAGPLNLTGLTAGLYTVSATLVNTPYCTVATTFTIDQPTASLAISETHTNITCVSGNNDGSISVSATGGWPGVYQFEVIKDGTLFSAYSDITVYNDLVSGSYTINVKDSKGCIDSVIVDLAIPTPISVTASPATQLLSCLGDKTGTVEAILVSGGQGSNYTYTLNYLSLSPVVSSGPQLSPIFTNLAAGSYSITVTDGYNCTAASAPVVINEPTEVKAALVLSRTATCLTPAQVTLTASGGTTPYRFSVDNVTYIPFTSGGSTTIDVVPGTYNYYVKDNNNCTAFQSNDIKVEAVPTLTVTLDLSNAKVNCFNDNKGVIVAEATGGLGNYVYTLYNGSGIAITPAPVQSTPGRFDGLVAGFYQVRVQSGLDCTVASAVEEVKQPATPITYVPTVTNVSCYGGNNGKVEIVASGGTGQIIYSISPNSNQFFDTGVFDRLPAGAYQIIIQDEAGCYEPFNFNISEPPILYATLVPNSLIPEVCDGDKDGAFSIEILGGTAPYKVSLDKRTGTYTQGAIGQTEFDFTNLSGGTHTVFFIDAAGCNSEIEVVMPNAIIINPIATLTYDCVNNMQANRVVVTYDASNAAADLDFDLDGLGNYQASNVFTDLAPGSHFINVRHTNGCVQATLPFTVDQIDPLALVINDGDLNQIKATASGGSGPYEYSFNGEEFTSQDTYVFYKSGNYTVVVRDKNGCTATVNRDFTYIDICIPNYFTPNNDGVVDTWAPGCTNNYPNLTFAIFDRYGREIARLRLGDKWDGKYNGAELPSGDYWYILKLNNNKDDREFVGHFTLYR